MCFLLSVHSTKRPLWSDPRVSSPLSSDRFGCWAANLTASICYLCFQETHLNLHRYRLLWKELLFYLIKAGQIRILPTFSFQSSSKVKFILVCVQTVTETNFGTRLQMGGPLNFFIKA